jgi:CO/xanthine dehydrogenase Mo-binding subunit
MDKVARTVGLAPDEFRRRNFVAEGQTTATSQVIREKVDMNHLLNRAFELTGYHEKMQRFARENARGGRGSSPTVREGVD